MPANQGPASPCQLRPGLEDDLVAFLPTYLEKQQIWEVTLSVEPSPRLLHLASAPHRTALCAICDYGIHPRTFSHAHAHAPPKKAQAHAIAAAAVVLYLFLR